MRNISDEKLDAIRKLKNNDNIIITKADTGNAIVILDEKDSIEKAKSLLANKQFKRKRKRNESLSLFIIRNKSHKRKIILSVTFYLPFSSSILWTA